VVSGLLKMSSDNESGQTMTFTGVPPGGWFGEGTALKRESYRYNIQPLRPSVVAGLPVDTFHWLIDHSLGFNRFIMHQLNERLGQFIAAREMDRMNNPELRLARHLAALFNPVLFSGVGEVLRITQQELAKAQAIDGAEQRVAAAKIAAETSQLNYNRTKDLFEKKLESQRNFELATLSRDSTIAELKSSEAALKRTSNDFDATIASTHASKGTALSEVATAERDLSAIDIQINQNLRQVVESPRDGIVLNVAATDGTYLRPGSLICVIIPETDSRFVEIMVDGNDMPLIQPRKDGQPGSPVRLAFEGWPAVQMIGWPQLAIGTFGGEVVFVDATDDGSGKFRVVVGPADDIVDRGDGKGPITVGWPEKDRWLRQGARANAWVMLNQVPLWFELWRQINGFPPVVSDKDGKLDPTKK
jgi:hypothetical protein